MENDILIQQFNSIEEKVEQLIGTCKSLGATNNELRDRIKSLETEIQTRVEAETTCANEKEMVRSKIDRLLHRLDEHLDS